LAEPRAIVQPSRANPINIEWFGECRCNPRGLLLVDIITEAIPAADAVEQEPPLHGIVVASENPTRCSAPI